MNTHTTPAYVTSGIDTLDSLIGEHIYAAREVEYDYGTFSSYEGITSNTGASFIVEGAPFSMRSYSWAECDCGFEEHEWNITVQAKTNTGLTDLDWDNPKREILTDEYKRLMAESGFTQHTETCTPSLPNFHHHATNFRACWYKHSHRGESCNKEISMSEWMGIQRECEDWVLGQPKGFRVLVTGSRDWAPELYDPVPGRKYRQLADDWKGRPSKDVGLMVEALREARTMAGGAHMRIVHGGAQGADILAAMLAQDADNASTESHPALWNRKKDGSYNRAAGFERNGRMVDSGVDLCLAFLKEGASNRGTQDCVRRARGAGIEVMEVWG